MKIEKNNNFMKPGGVAVSGHYTYSAFSSTKISSKAILMLQITVTAAVDVEV